MKTYVAERQVEYWTSRQVEQFFLQHGYECVAVPVSPNVEKHLPADFIFACTGPVKLFGLQYKVLYQNGSDCWRLDSHQHSQLAWFPWIQYGLSDITQVADFRSALFALRIKKTNFNFQRSLQRSRTGPYIRWWMFFQRLLQCTIGVRVTSASHLHQLLSPDGTDVPARTVAEIADIFLIAPNAERLIHIVGQPDPDSGSWWTIVEEA